MRAGAVGRDRERLAGKPDKLLEDGRVTTDPTKRREVYARAEEHMVKNVPYIPYYVIKRAFLTTASVRGFLLDVRAFEVFTMPG